MASAATTYLSSEVAATVFDQTALISGRSNLTVLVLLSGAAAYYFIADAVKINGIGRSNATWNVLSTVLGVIIGIVIFEEKITKRNMTGIIFACIGLYLMDGLLVK